MRLSDEYVYIMGHITIITTYGKRIDVRAINVIYLIVDVVSLLNIILGWSTINTMGAIISTMYLTLRYLFTNGRVIRIPGDLSTSELRMLPEYPGDSQRIACKTLINPATITIKSE